MHPVNGPFSYRTESSYGSLGAAVGLLFYLHLCASVVLLGAEVNAAIHNLASDGSAQAEKQGSGWGYARPSEYTNPSRPASTHQPLPLREDEFQSYSVIFID